MINRSKVLKFADKLILQFYQNHYLKKNVSYHPLPWLGISRSLRSEGCYERRKALFDFLSTSRIKAGVALDVGCNVGFFSLSLKERGFYVYGVDNNKFSLTIAQTLGHSITAGKFFPMNMSIDVKTVEYLPTADICLCLSIWHHWVEVQGLKNATTMLKTLYTKTNKVLFFDTARINNGFSGNQYLARTLRPKQVILLGEFSAPETTPDKTIKRELFAVIKK